MLRIIKSKIIDLIKTSYANVLYSYKSIMVIASLFLVILSSYYIKSLFKFKAKNKIQNFVVAYDSIQRKDIPIIINTHGKVQAISNVVIKPQIDGTILNSYFEEGSIISKGQLLFEIDSSSLQAMQNQSIANVNRSAADLKNAELQLNKHTKLYQKKFISEQEYEQILANFKISKANHEAAMASLDASKIQLGFTKIYSPINGIAGQILVKPGNVVKSVSNSGLVNINQLNPIQVSFTISDEYLLELTKNIQQLEKFEVKLIDYNNTGKLVFIDNHVDDLSGTILLKAEFDNANYTLWPGKFVNIALHLKTLPQALVIPNRAIQIGQNGSYVYTVEIIKNFKNTYRGKVTKTLIEVGDILNNETVVINGLQEGQMVVTEGHGHLADQMIVEMYAK